MDGQEQEKYMGQMTHQGYVLFPEYLDFFNKYLTSINELREIVDKKWTPEQQTAYETYLNVLQDFIYNYIATGQVYLYSDFEARFQNYRATINPVGAQLFDKQANYLENKKAGVDFRKKGKKDKPKTTPAPAPKAAESTQPKEPEKEKEVVRKDDPKIDLEVLQNTNWDELKYPNASLLKKPNVNMVFIGHVDAGKSTLSGRITLNMGLVDEQEYKKLQQEAKANGREGWELAYINDIDQREREKGKTVECSKTTFMTATRRYTVFDAPGHKNYVPNMILGACQADVAILIISAKEGEYESGFDKDGQTKEHAMLARALGVNTLFCTVTKMHTINWDKTRFDKIQSEVSAYLKSACGYENVQFIPTDSLADLNIDKRNIGTVCPWYNGPSLLEYLDIAPLTARSGTAPLRIPIMDKMKEQGQTYLYGKVESGTLLEDQTVSLLPTRQYFTIKEIYNPKDERLPYATAGENVKLKVKDLDEEQVKRGFMICNNMNYCQVCEEFQARLTVLELPAKKQLMSSGYQCVIHLHASLESVEVTSVEAVKSAETKKLVKSTFIKNGQTGIVNLKASNEMCLEKFDFMPGLGRFTLRDEGRTIAYGEILKFKASQTLTVEQKAQLGLPTSEMANMKVN